jgi:hypothetical protein
MKANQVYSFFKDFKFSKNYLLMNYKLNKILSQTSKRNADLSHTNSWGHKLYIKGSNVKSSIVEERILWFVFVRL